jgi:signal transduction histidine kinase/ligand-binding sensor domain-containing protein/DNA-binding response OmpR family regulator
MQKYCYTITILVLLLGKDLLGQKDIFLRVKKISIYQGLSNSIINAIVQDHHGFMWFATEDGLNKYDGYNFTVFKNNPNDLTSISNNFISALYFDQATHQLWISTNNGLNIYDYNKESFRRIQSRPGDRYCLNWNVVSSICSSKKDIVWVGTYGGGIGYIEKKTLKFVHVENIQGCTNAFLNNKVIGLLEDANENVWIGSQDDGLDLYLVKGKKILHFKAHASNLDSLPSNSINTIFEDREKNIWVGTPGGLSLYVPAENSFITFEHQPLHVGSLGSDIVKTIMQDHSGTIWIGTQSGGISKIRFTPENIHHPDKANFEHIYESEDEFGLSYNSVQSLFEDRDKNIWIGTYTGGINFISNFQDKFSNIKYYKDDAGSLSHHKVWGICDDPEGNIWIGTDGGGINKYNPRTGKVIKVYRHDERNPNSINSNAILSACRDHNGDLWFGTYNGGLNKYNRNTDGFIHYVHQDNDPSSIGCNDVRVIYEDAGNNLHIGTNGAGVSLFLSTTGKFLNFNKDELQKYGSSIRTILQDRSGNYWYGAYGNGLIRLHPDRTTYDHFINNTDDPHSIGNSTIYALFQDRKGRIWVGTERGGLSLYHPESNNFENFAEKEGLDNYIVRAIGEDNVGYIWVSTNKGLSRFSTEEKKFVNFDIHDGLTAGQFLDGSFLYSGGIMYFGNQNGLCYFSPEKIELNTIAPKVNIVDLQLFNKKVSLRSAFIKESPLIKTISETDTIRLTYKQSVFSLGFVAVNYNWPEKIHYAYKLEALEKDWNMSGNEHQATYRNLRPGKYLFKVKASNINGIWNDSYTSLCIIISPPLWYTWWAWCIYTLFIVSIVFLLYIYKAKQAALKQNLMYEKITRQKEHQLNQEKMRFFTNMTHEFRSPLTLIQGPLEDLLQEPQLSRPVSKKILLIYCNSNRLLELINKLLDFRKVETGSMQLKVIKGDLVRAVKECCYPYRELFIENKIEFSLKANPEEIEVWFDPEKLMIIMNNLLSNASKYTKPKGQVTVEISEEGNKEYAVIKVWDTGIGIAPEHLETVFEQYYRIEEIKGVNGSGIGLALTRNLVEMHKGTILAESVAGMGSCFTVKLKKGRNHFSDEQIDVSSGGFFKPFNGFKSNLDMEQEEPQPESDHDDAQRKIMLIVEDNDEIRSYIKDSFADEFQIIEAVDGSSGLEMAFKYIPDIIITDIMMPGIDGLELCSKVKTSIKTSHIPVVILTARNTIQQKQEGYETGADSYVTKPFSTSLLKSRIRNILLARKHLTEHIARTILLQPDEIHINLKDEKFISDAIRIIESRMADENFDVDALGLDLGVSRSVLYRKIKALTGFNIVEFIRSIRLKNAAQFLRTKEYTVSEVAYKVGFNNLKHFRLCFKEQFKVSPSDYQKSEVSSGE